MIKLDQHIKSYGMELVYMDLNILILQTQNW